jgi:hypothetical protein
MAQNNFTIEIKVLDIWNDVITLKDYILCEIGITLYLLENDN